MEKVSRNSIRASTKYYFTDDEVAKNYKSEHTVSKLS
jgi:hypothetical protein